MLMRRFGAKWGAPICDALEQTPVPVGSKCDHCGEKVRKDDAGVLIDSFSHDPGEVVLHWECHTRSIIGGVNHQLGRCHCCGGNQPPDPPELSLRRSAVMAVELWEGATSHEDAIAEIQQAVEREANRKVRA